MSEFAIREILVFAGALAGAVWGYFLGKLLERRRLAREMRSSLQALERWAVQVCEGLDGLERSLDIPPAPAVEAAGPRSGRDATQRAEPGAGRRLRRLIAGLGTAPAPRT